MVEEQIVVHAVVSKADIPYSREFAVFLLEYMLGIRNTFANNPNR